MVDPVPAGAGIVRRVIRSTVTNFVGKVVAAADDLCVHRLADAVDDIFNHDKGLGLTFVKILHFIFP